MTPLDLFNKNIHLADAVVLGVMRKNQHRGRECQDLKQVALLSIWLSANKWKDNGGPPFGPYAVQRIRFAINDYTRMKTNKVEGREILDFGYMYDLDFAVEARRIYQISKNIKLTARERQIIDLYIDFGLNLDDIAKNKNVDLCGERVRQIKNHAIKKIGKHIREKRMISL